MSVVMRVPCSIGDALDRLSILSIKADRIRDPDKIAHVRREQAAIEEVAGRYREAAAPLYAALERLNGELWDIEDAIRDREAAGDFGPEFVRLARAVYSTNDRRAEVKRQINAEQGSELVEVKSYSAGPAADADDDADANVKLFILPHMGLGDMIVLAGMVRTLAEHTTELVMPVFPRNMRAARQLFQGLHIDLLPVENDEDISPSFGADGTVLHAYADRGFRFLPLGLHATAKADWSRHPDFSHGFYIQAGMDHALSYSAFGLRRDPRAEAALYDRVVAKHGKDYVFLHEDAARGHRIVRALVKSELPVVDAHDPDVRSDNIFDYCLVMERARELHFMDSCFGLLADRLPGVICPMTCHAYARRNGTHPSLYAKPVRMLYAVQSRRPSGGGGA